ncbi:outer membrane protein assembly factor BamA [Verrucomicrobia bacterium LW23]|nr:outer membrane protein assembly factor BamA [Verrucomicrobia bacterium LW23]PTY04315.1 outer membrane protein assembly factor BamA [Verrucomicrobia bacterium LW23]
MNDLLRTWLTRRSRAIAALVVIAGVLPFFAMAQSSAPEPSNPMPYAPENAPAPSTPSSPNQGLNPMPDLGSSAQPPEPMNSTVDDERLPGETPEEAAARRERWKKIEVPEALDSKPFDEEAEAGSSSLHPVDVERRARVSGVSSDARVQFVGNASIPETELLEVIQDQRDNMGTEGLTLATADDAAFYVAQYYRRKGYMKVRVLYRIEGARLVLDVDEGELVRLGNVVFIGNASYDGTKLGEYILGPTHERKSTYKDGLPFIRADIDLGLQRAQGFYRSEGYPYATISSSFRLSRDGRSMDMTVTVNEGPRYLLGPFYFEGNGRLSPDDIQKELATGKPIPYSELSINTLQRKVEDIYRNSGYYTRTVEVKVAKPKGRKSGALAVTFNVEQGPLYRIGDVHVTGAKDIRSEFVEKRFRRMRGHVYDPRDVEDTYKRMVQAGLYTQFVIEPVPRPDGTLDLNIAVKEAKPREFGIYGGYGTYEGPYFGVNYRNRNFFGSARSFEAVVEGSARGGKAEVIYLDPWFLDTDLELKSRLYSMYRYEDQYSKIETGLRNDLSWDVDRYWRVGAFQWARQVNILQSDIDEQDLGPTSYFANSIGVTQTYDRRNNKANPTSGYHFTTSFDMANSAIASDIEYVRFVYRSGVYVPLGKVVLAFGAQGGLISPIKNSELPVDERFYLGGSTTIRSFAEREMGPRDRSGNFIGGNSYMVYNAEVIFPIWGDLKGAVFADMGALYENSGDFLSFNDMRYALGAGLRYGLPIGAMRLDYGWNPDMRPNEDVGALHFGFGMAF